MILKKSLSKPLIGIIPDYKNGEGIGYSKRPHHAINVGVVKAISESGGVPILIPYDFTAIDDYLNLIDGLMIIGGAFDISPIRYGENNFHPAVKLNKVRENFEFEIAKKALANGKLPILGICNGMQLISILHGSKIIQHIPDNKNFIDHEQSHNPEFKDYKKPYHEVLIEKNSKFFDIVQANKISVNSSHHQAVADVSGEIIICGKSPDGIIEAVEHKTHPFCLGVQWHPEFLVSDADKKIFEAFVEKAKIAIK